jgi:Protein of unknown function (DUF664)
MQERPRLWPERELSVDLSVLGFLDFVNTTAVNKLSGLSDTQARATPIPSSPVVSALGLIKHLTAVQRQHIQIHIGNADLPPLWNSADHDEEFRVTSTETIESVIAAFDAECELSRQTLSRVDLDSPIVAYGEPNTAGRLLVDVLQECARHLGHLDVVRELIDGVRGE